MIGRALHLTAMGALALAACAHAPERSAGYPLLDADCSEYEGLGAHVVDASDGVTLYAFQDAHYVFLCASLPPESLGTADLKLTTPAQKSELNLHVSAQIGEWNTDDPDSAPQTMDSDRWWRVSGWFAPAVRVNGYEDAPSGRRIRFIPSEGREWQLSKARFGRGEWKFSLRLNQVRNSAGERISVVLPKDGVASLDAY